jgi:hypothetical protein
MMLERINEVTNVGRPQFVELVLDVLQLLTFEKLHYAIAKIIEHMPNQGLAITKGNHKCFRIRHVNDLLCDQPSSLVQKLLAFSIRNKMIMYPKMNPHF